LSNNPKRYSCKQCGDPFDAYPPDDYYTYAMIKKCFVCDALGLGKHVERNYECNGCDTKNTVYWYYDHEHTRIEIINAQSKRRSIGYIIDKFKTK